MFIIDLLLQICLYLPMMLGAYISLVLMKIPSLSIESAYVAGAIAAGLVSLTIGTNNFLGLIFVLIAGFIGGALVGIVAGCFAQKVNFSHLLASIVTIGFFQGLFQWILQGTQLKITDKQSSLAHMYLFTSYSNFLVIFMITLGLIAFIFWFLKTELGMSCAIYGDNINFLKNYRISESYVVIFGLAISNGLVGISGYLVAQSSGYVTSSMGIGTPLFCISSLIIGKSVCLTFPSLIKELIPIIGIVGYFLMQIFLLSLGFELQYFTAVQAFIVALFLVYLSKIRTGILYQDSLGL